MDESVEIQLQTDDGRECETLWVWPLGNGLFRLEVTPALANLEEEPVYAEDVIAADGGWERLFGGLLYVHVPADSLFDVERELERRMAAAR